MLLHVDVVSDVICPWCFIGKRRLEKALRALTDRVETRIVWHPFELNPEMPQEGMDRTAYREAKFGSAPASQALDARLTAVGAAEGIPFAFDRIRRTPNTLDAHRLIWFAAREALQEHVVEALFQKYFIDGEDVGRRQTLIDVAVGCGMRGEAAGRFLDGGDGTSVVRQAEAEAWSLGIHGVPHFIIDGKYAVSGAQGVEILTSIFEQVLTQQSAQASTPGSRAGSAPADP